MSAQHPIIQLGLDLLRNRSIEPDELQCFDLEGSVNVFSVLGIDITIPLKLAALQSVFDSSTAPIHSSPKYYTPAELNPKVINYPNQNNPSIDFSNVVPPDGLLADALVQLERYGSFVSTSANSQLPLYDQFKTAAALHDCLINGVGQEKCVLVACDFSGIQDTVYTITSKGALKTLRARSFMLELLTEHLIHELLYAASSYRYSVIYSGGGGFCLLLPNKDSLINKIKEYAECVNKWALNEFSGRLFIAIDAMSCLPEQFIVEKKTFQNLRQLQADNLDRQKLRKFGGLLKGLFTVKMPEQLTVKTECQVTRRDDLPATQMFDINNLHEFICMSAVSPKEREEDKWTWVSESCFHQYRLGDKLTDATYVYCYRHAVDRSKKVMHGTLILPGLGNRFVSYSVDKVPGATPDGVWKINAWDEGPALQCANYVRKHRDLSLYARNKENESLAEEGRSANEDDMATFQGLSASSCGADLIGALRMDVDNLGDMFIKIDSIALLSARSRMLNLFFKVYINEICGNRTTDILNKNRDKEERWGKVGRNVSVIYSGGDDLFIVGAWDECTELVFDIQEHFVRFTHGRGISGGVTLHQPKFPLYQMARLSADAEAFAKRDADGDDPNLTKNRIALFYDHSKLHRQRQLGTRNHNRYMLSMTWGLAGDYLLDLMRVYSLCGRQKGKGKDRKVFELNKNTISYQTIEKWFMVLETYRSKGLLYFPIMARVLNDIEKAFGLDEAEIFKKLFIYLYTKPYTEELYLANLHIALNWLSYLGRKK